MFTPPPLNPTNNTTNKNTGMASAFDMSMPPLVDPNQSNHFAAFPGHPSPYSNPNSPFLHPPPPGVTSGGQPGGGGLYDPLPGAGGGCGGAFGGGAGFGGGGGGGPLGLNSGWPQGTWASGSGPHSAPPTTSFPGFGGMNAGYPTAPFPGYPPFNAPNSAGFGNPNSAFPGMQATGYPGGSGGGNVNTPALSFGAPTPAGSYGPPTTPGGHTPWSGPGMAGPAADPWGIAGGSGGGGGLTPGGFFGGQTPEHKEKKKKKRSSSMKRATSEGTRVTSAHEKALGRSNSFGGGALSPSPFGASPGGYPPFGGGAYPSFAYPPFASPPPFGLGYPPFNGGMGNPNASPAYPPFDPTGGMWAGPDPYGPKNLARRPRDWRADYVTPKKMGGVGGGGLMGWVSGVGKGRSDVQEVSDPVKRKLHPLLEWKMDKPPVEHDLRTNPLTSEDVFTMNRPHNQIDLAQLACNPPATFMRLYHPGLPWYVDVRATHPNGVTVHDVMTQMYVQLMKGITPRHWWNEEVGEELRVAISSAYTHRVSLAERRGDQSERARGVVWLDWLGDRFIFEGLARGRNGMWEIKTAREGVEGQAMY